MPGFFNCAISWKFNLVALGYASSAVAAENKVKLRSVPLYCLKVLSLHSRFLCTGNFTPYLRGSQVCPPKLRGKPVVCMFAVRWHNQHFSWALGLLFNMEKLQTNFFLQKFYKFCTYFFLFYNKTCVKVFN
jgi:hypothetical protein